MDATNSPADSTAPDALLTRRQALGLLGALALPAVADDAAAATAPAPGAAPTIPQLPDLPNFHGMMEWLAREHAPRLSFLDSRWSDLAAWKAAARPFLREKLSYNPKPVPLAADLVRREERDGFTVEVINIRATPAYHIPARVLVPHGTTGRRPAVLALHCHSGRYTWGHEKILSSPGEPAHLTQNFL